MKLTGKKIKSMLLCMMLAMAFTVAGCGSKAEGTADAQKNTETAIVNTETIVETEAVAEVCELAVISGQTPYHGVGDVFLSHISHSLLFVKSFSIKFRPKSGTCQFF